MRMVSFAVLSVVVTTGAIAESRGWLDAIASIAIDPRHPETIYLTMPLGVYRSMDGGEMWEFADGEFGMETSALAIDPNDTAIIYANARSGIIKSVDHGKNWRWLPGVAPYWGYSIVIDPNNSATVYAGGEGRVYKSTDGGLNWKIIFEMQNENEMQYEKRIKLAIDPRKPSIIYAGACGRHGDDTIFKSTDGGKKWKVINKGIDDPDYYYELVDVVVSQHDSNIIYGVFSDHLYKSVNGGKRWKKLAGSPGADGNSLHRDTVLTSNPQIIYLHADRGISRSIDGGISWKDVESGYVQFFVVDPHNPEIIYAGFDNIIRKSTDGGHTWKLITNGLPNINRDY
jgi:photosystem II stability/assembly factor-like uncharacterized protein